MDVSEDELQSLYTWVDEIPLSRPKRNIARDFSDGVLVAEVVANFFPRLVELHNYSAANSLQQKLYNWSTLNSKVFRKLGFQLPKDDQTQCANSVPGAIERVLKLLRIHISDVQARGGPEAVTQTLSGVSSVSSPGSAAATSSSGMLRSGGLGGGGLGAVAPQDLMQVSPVGPILSTYMSAGGKAGLGARGAAAELLQEKEATIIELREMNEIMETKVRKLEQLVKLKDAKIHTLMAKLQASGLL